MGTSPRVSQIALDDGAIQSRIVTPANVSVPAFSIHSLLLYQSLESIYPTHTYSTTSMVNTFNTEPDPEPDLEPDIRGYSQSNNQVNRGITSTTQPEPLSFVSSEPVPLAPIATRDATINEKDYATPGIAGTGHGTMETTLNPSPSGQDTTSIYSSHHPDDEDQEPAFPFISWKTSAIVRLLVSGCSINC